MGATASIAITGADTLNKFVSGRRAAKGAEDQGAYEAGIYNENAALADAQAADAIARGAVAEQRYRSGVKGVIGSQRASLAAQGLDLSSGSPADVQADTAHTGELDALMIRTNAAREAFGFKVDAVNNRNRAALATTAARNTAAGLRNEAFSTLLTGGLQTYGMGKDLGKWGQKGGAKPPPKTSKSSYQGAGLY